MKIPQNLFDLTPDQEATSKMMYDGKTIRCLVAPYHTYAMLEKAIAYSPTTYLFPERDLPITQLRNLISMIVANPKHQEFQIVTANQNIILDMVDSCVRVLTEDGTIVPCPVKTFMANIHDIRYSLLENEEHQIPKEDKSRSREKIQNLITRLQTNQKVTQKEYDELEKEVNLIGEDVISGILKNHLEDLEII
jgi:hypothetical protein